MEKLKHFLSILVTHPLFEVSDHVKDFLVDTDEYVFKKDFEEATEKGFKTKIVESTNEFIKNFSLKLSRL